MVTAEEVGEPAYQPEAIPQTKSLLVQVGVKAMYVGVVGLFDGGEPRLRYQRVPLDDRFADSRGDAGTAGVVPGPTEDGRLGGSGRSSRSRIPAAGSSSARKACQECHDEDYDVWKKSKHAHALQTR